VGGKRDRGRRGEREEGEEREEEGANLGHGATPGSKQKHQILEKSIPRSQLGRKGANQNFQNFYGIHDD
jgi:hypothetical protein